MRVTTRQLGLWSKLMAKVPFSGRKAPLGYDLAGNRYYELPNPQGGRPRRVVEYADSPTSYAFSSVEDYRSGTAQLPVQWSAWMSYTRDTPPSMDELERDHARQTRLAERVKLIEARERQERIAQGYLNPDGSEVAKERIVEVGGAKRVVDGGGLHSSAKFAFPPPKPAKEGGVVTDQGENESRQRQVEAPVQKSGLAEAFEIAARSSQNQIQTQSQSLANNKTPNEKLAQPKTGTTDEAAALRKLAEEDTRRRMRELGVAEETTPQPVQSVASGGRLRPRKRGPTSS